MNLIYILYKYYRNLVYMLSQYFISAYTDLHMNRLKILYKSYMDPHIDLMDPLIDPMEPIIDCVDPLIDLMDPLIDSP